MNAYECLEDEACMDGIDVMKKNFKSKRIKGLYCNGAVAISDDLDTIQSADTLAEEMGHHYTSVGDILDLSDVQNRKQERQARVWAYNKRIGLDGLVRAYEHGCKSRYEVAEFLEVTEESLESAVQCYRDKYGVCTSVESYTIYFIPQLMILKRL